MDIMELDPNKPMDECIKEILTRLENLHGNRVDQLIKPHFVSCDPSVPSVTICYNVATWQLNHFDTMHGGMISTIFDNSLGCLSHYIVKSGLVTTATLTTNYIKPIPLDSNVYVTAKATAIGKTLIHLSGEAHLEDSNKLVATATAIYMIIKKPLTKMSSYTE